MNRGLSRRLDELEKIRAVAAAGGRGTSQSDDRELEQLWKRVEAWHADPANQESIAAQAPELLGTEVQHLREKLSRAGFGYEAS